ncbi:diptericin-A [Drosophila busckii]|uniref:diptericin-A n=1 Tax=Drosophila busckii TaxID=30019 RepID=UPI0014330032|nr:diptericin-A [Drosophila busckii]
MQISLSLLLLGLFASCALAYPYPYAYEQAQDLEAAAAYTPEEQSHERVRRQFSLQGGGGGSPRQGFDLSLNGRAPVWQSQNGRHSLDALGQFSQHLGGPYGNSRPNWGAGAAYTFRF